MRFFLALLIAIISLHLLTIPAAAQIGWFQQVSNTTEDLNGVFFSINQVGAAVGHSGLVRYTTNGGSTWLSGNSGTSQRLRKVFFNGATTATAVGNSGTIIHTTNGGATWSARTSGTTADLYDLLFGSALIGVVVGESGTVRMTSDGGVTWTPVTTGSSKRLKAIFATDPFSATIVGNDGTVLYTGNGGLSWTQQNSGTSEDLNGVFFTDPNNGIIVGDAGTILLTTDAGTSWTPRNSGTTQDLHRLFTTPTSVYTVGNGGAILRSTDGGLTWAPQFSGTSQNLNAVFFTHPDTGTAVGNGGIILRTVNGGVPVELLSFIALRLQNGVVRLHWTTATETNNYGFDVERQTSMKWETAAFIRGRGTSTVAQEYTWFDLAPPSGPIRYRLKQTDLDGSMAYSPIVEVAASTLPTAVTLEQNHPNPFGPRTHAGNLSSAIRFSLPGRSHVSLRVFDVFGRERMVLVNEELPGGFHEQGFQGETLPSGTYFYRLETGTHALTRTFQFFK